ncbi:MAG: DUF4388 domain-containing protein [Clostridiales bacterium]|nr:DUF4388 domain-containing protein [Clostridiales bacterium]
MDDHSARGNLAYTPLPQLLLRIWEKKRTGLLRLQKEDTARILSFSRGDLALTDISFPAEEFQAKLIEAEILSGEEVEATRAYALEKNVSLMRGLIECEMLSPQRTWEFLASFWLESLYPLFDWPDGEYAFDSAGELSGQHILMTVASLEFILQGIRRMGNSSLIEASLPAESESLQVLSPGYAGLLRLASYEKYVLNLLRHSPRLQDLYAQSHLGKKETQKVIFSLVQLGLAGFRQPRNAFKPASESSSGEAEKIWSDFNDKCSSIYKYISKEIGPVALNVLEKALDEVKPRLSSLLQSLELRTDGRIELRPVSFLSLNFSNPESRKAIIQVLNEILVAEVLAVKKTLGDDHEAALIRNLEKIGDQG